MKKILFALAIIALAASCKKSTEDAPITPETQYIRIVAVDNDGFTTVSQVLTVKTN